MGRHNKDFLNAGTQVIPILGERVELAHEYASKLELPFPVLADPERELYQLYGLQKAIIVIQRSAYFIIDKQGIIQSMKTTINPLVWLDEYDQIFQEVLRINQSYNS